MKAIDFISLQISHMRKLLADSLKRLQLAKFSPESLNEGAWYCVDYYRFCKKWNLQESLTPLVKEASFFHGYASFECFELMEDPRSPSGYRIYSFALKKEKRPSQALLQMQRGPSLLDCGLICYLASYLAFLDVLGEEKFDHLFDARGPFSMLVSGDESATIGAILPKKILKNEKEVLSGDIAYFCNCKEYLMKHPAGEARGFNVIACQEEVLKYLGFGLSPEGLCREGIEYNLFECFNEEPIDEGFYPQRVWQKLYSEFLLGNEEKSRALVGAFSSKTISWQEYQNKPARLPEHLFPMDGKMGLWVQRPHLTRIQELIEAPLDEVWQRFGSYQGTGLMVPEES